MAFTAQESTGTGPVNLKVVPNGSMGPHVCIVITHSKSKDQRGKVANPAHGQLNRENLYFSVPVRA